MQSSVKTVLILLVALPLAIWLGLSVGDETLQYPAILGVLVIVVGVALMNATKVRLEAVMISMLIGGYIIGNRGFAQLAVIPSTPTYVGEVGMTICAFALLARIPFTKGRIFPPDSLSPAIFIFLVMGCSHMAFEYRTYEMLALRDFAVVYYAFMFVIGYWVGLNESSYRTVTSALGFSLICLIPLFPLATWIFPDFFDGLEVRGLPIILYKDDLVTTYYSIGAIFFYLYWQFRRPKSIVAMLLPLGCLGLMFYTGKRAGYVGFGCAVILMVVAYRTRVLRHLGYAILLFAVIVLPIEAYSFERFQDTHAYDLLVRIETMFDISGTGKYEIGSAEVSAQNNRFRTYWWRCVTEETLEKSPVFGLGFGYNLAARFLRTYEMPISSEFDARSPHSYLFTILGRMGLLGVASLLSILVLIVTRATRVALRIRRHELPPEALGYWLYTIAILGSAFLGVVLEGPMGGILFWSFLGIAAGTEARLNAMALAEDGWSQAEAAEPPVLKPLVAPS